MAFLFAKPLSPAEQLKKHKREIDRAIRDLERERTKLQMQEKKIIAEIRKAAAQNQQVSRLLTRRRRAFSVHMLTPPLQAAAREPKPLPHGLRASRLAFAVRGQDHGKGPGSDA